MDVSNYMPDFRVHPVLDPGFVPFGLFVKKHEAAAREEVKLALERSDGVSVFTLKLFNDGGHDEEDFYYAQRRVKFELWQKGGFRLYVADAPGLCEYLRECFSPEGCRAFDYDFMSRIYGRAFEIISCREAELPEASENPEAPGGHMEGCRIGFDAGASARKVSALIDGKTVFTERVPWNPRYNPDWKYHQSEIRAGLRSAAAHLPRVDAVGISTAGVIIDNRVKMSSIFLALPEKDMREHGESLFTDTVKELTAAPCTVCNDGEVSALAAAMSLNTPAVLGISLGSSEGVGFLNAEGHITGWLNELAFAPVDEGRDAERDEWSGDLGVGCKYLSQDAVIRLAERSGIYIEPSLPASEKTLEIQRLMDEGSEAAADIYRTVGVYLGHTLPYYRERFGCREILLMGGVVAGSGGKLILNEALRVLNEDYPELEGKLHLQLPEGELCRIGQSAAAASLPGRR